VTVDFTSPWPWVGIAVLVAVLRCGAWLRREIRNAGPDMDPLPTCPETEDDVTERWADLIEYSRAVRHEPDHPAVVADLDARRRQGEGL
jgi:hypothetical protein